MVLTPVSGNDYQVPEAMRLFHPSENGGDPTYIMSRETSAEPFQYGKCFVAGTLVHMAPDDDEWDDTETDVECCADGEIGTLAACLSAGTVYHAGELAWDVTLQNERGQVETVAMALEHSFWVDDNRWVKAGALAAGDTFIGVDGKARTVLGIMARTWDWAVEAQPASGSKKGRRSAQVDVTPSRRAGTVRMSKRTRSGVSAKALQEGRQSRNRAVSGTGVQLGQGIDVGSVPLRLSISSDEEPAPSG
jgi:hypothetical protein